MRLVRHMKTRPWLQNSPHSGQRPCEASRALWRSQSSAESRAVSRTTSSLVTLFLQPTLWPPTFSTAWQTGSVSGAASLSGEEEEEQKHNILLPAEAATALGFSAGGGTVLATGGLVRGRGSTLLGSVTSSLAFLQTSEEIFSGVSNGLLTGAAACDCLAEIVMLGFSWFGLKDFLAFWLERSGETESEEGRLRLVTLVMIG